MNLFCNLLLIILTYAFHFLVSSTLQDIFISFLDMKGNLCRGSSKVSASSLALTG